MHFLLRHPSFSAFFCQDNQSETFPLFMLFFFNAHPCIPADMWFKRHYCSTLILENKDQFQTSEHDLLVDLVEQASEEPIKSNPFSYVALAFVTICM